MKYATLRRFALSLPEVGEAPHFHFGSFRVPGEKGKIFVTVPPGETHIHVFVSEQHRDSAVTLHPEAIEKLFWGARVIGVRIALAAAPVAIVKQLVETAWREKAPKRLLGELVSR